MRPGRRGALWRCSSVLPGLARGGGRLLLPALATGLLRLARPAAHVLLMDASRARSTVLHVAGRSPAIDQVLFATRYATKQSQLRSVVQPTRSAYISLAFTHAGSLGWGGWKSPFALATPALPFLPFPGSSVRLSLVSDSWRCRCSSLVFALEFGMCSLRRSDVWWEERTSPTATCTSALDNISTQVISCHGSRAHVRCRGLAMRSHRYGVHSGMRDDSSPETIVRPSDVREAMALIVT